MLQVYGADAVHAALPWPALADALARAFIEGAEVPVRQAHALSATDTLLLMPAWSPQALGVKLVTVMPGAATTVQATYLLFDRATGQPRALIDGEALTLRRTAATSVLAARCLARPASQRLLLVGAGRLAGWMARAYGALWPALDELTVWGRRADAVRALAGELAAEGLPASAAAPDLEAAVRRADIVCCATTSTVPLVRGDWLRAGQHLDLVGAFRPDMREVDDQAVVRSRVVVDTFAGGLAEAGDLTQPIASGAIDRGHVVAELAQVLRGECVGRRGDRDITLFKSVGTALEDLAAAALVCGEMPESPSP